MPLRVASPRSVAVVVAGAVVAAAVVVSEGSRRSNVDAPPRPRSRAGGASSARRAPPVALGQRMIVAARAPSLASASSWRAVSRATSRSAAGRRGAARAQQDVLRQARHERDLHQARAPLHARAERLLGVARPEHGAPCSSGCRRSPASTASAGLPGSCQYDPPRCSQPPRSGRAAPSGLVGLDGTRCPRGAPRHGCRSRRRPTCTATC